MAAMHATLVATLVCLLIITPHSAAAADDFVGVGGFVTAAPAFSSALEAQGLPKPDLSAVVVDLLTPNGVKKAQGVCSPNGYYFAAFFGGSLQGAFTARVRGPPGWVFEPAAAQVTCTSDGCHNNEDLNFQLAGLALTGRVEAAPASASCSAAPGDTDGVTLQLLPKGATPDAKPLATAASKGGGFAFPDVLPGEYVLKAAHAGWALEPESMAVTVGLEASTAPAPFRVTGYRVTGKVTSKAGPVPGIRVTLHSSDTSTAGCSGGSSAADTAAAQHTKHGSAICAASTDADGVFEFAGVPCGRYGVIAVHPDPDSTFEIAPTETEVSVGRGEAKLAQPFTITGFSVEGRVVDGAGKGVGGARMTTDSGSAAVTDAAGRYILTRMEEGRCSVSAAKDGYLFEQQQGVDVSPVVKALPDFVATKVAVCGSVSMSDGRFSSKRRVSVVSAKDGTAAEEPVAVDGNGAFCVLLAPGSYRLAPVVAAEEKAKGLVFSPGHVDVDVASAPLHGIDFSQGELSIYGSVQCLESPCAAGVTLTLTPQAAAGKGTGGARARTFRLSEIALQEQTQADFTKFRLSGVVPGSYKLSATKPGWCWQQDHTTVTLSSTDAEAAPLSQEGHELSVVLSHDATLAITGPDGRSFEQEVPAGRAAICLPGSGEFVIVPRSCHVFGRERIAVVTPALPQPLTLTATKALIKGTIKVTDGDAPTAISLLVTPLTSGTEPFTVEAAPQPGVTGSTYTYSLALDVGDSLRLEPSAPGLLLYPASRVVEHTEQGRGCQPDVGVFEARPGLQLRGSTEPPIEGVEVVARYKAPSAAGNIGAAGETAASGVTATDGTFTVGPLYDDAQYEVVLSKPGTEFAAKSGGPDYVFSAKKLAQVHVSVELSSGAASSSPAFVSLSGERGFKSNAKLGSKGDHTFYGLRPGTYYLRPLLREYQFEPALAEVSLTEGEDATVAFAAKRVAWGITGTVTSVNGNALPGAIVEAVSEPSDASVTPESGVTDADGRYHIQGLAPGSEYRVTIRLDGRVTAAWPPSRTVPLSRADAEGVDFVAFRSASRASITGALALPAPLAGAGDSGVRLELRSAEGSGGETRAGRVDGAGFFEIGDVKPGAYVLRMSCAGGGCGGWERAVAVGTSDVDLGVLPVPGVVAKGGGSSRGGGLAEEGRSWWPQVLGVVLLVALGVLQKEAVVDMLQLDTAGWHGAITGGAAGTEAAAADAANDWLKDSQSLKESQSMKRRQPAAGRRA